MALGEGLQGALGLWLKWGVRSGDTTLAKGGQGELKQGKWKQGEGRRRRGKRWSVPFMVPYVLWHCTGYPPTCLPNLLCGL